MASDFSSKETGNSYRNHINDSNFCVNSPDSGEEIDSSADVFPGLNHGIASPP